MTTFIQVLVAGILSGGIYALVALGLVLIYKATRVFNFAVGTIMVFGAYLFWTLVAQVGLPLWLSGILVVICALLLGAVLERLFMRPLIGQPILAPIIVCLALLGLVRALNLFFFGGYEHSYKGIFPAGAWHLGGISISQVHVLAFAIAIAFIGLFALYFRYTRSGLAMKVTAEDHQVAQNLGIDVKGVFRNAWAISALVAVTGGILLASLQGVDDTIELIGLKGFAVVLLGGLESIPGAIVGGLIVGVLEALAGGYLTDVMGGGIAETFPFIILILVLLIRPYGIFGLERIERI